MGFGIPMTYEAVVLNKLLFAGICLVYISPQRGEVGLVIAKLPSIVIIKLY